MRKKDLILDNIYFAIVLIFYYFVNLLPDTIAFNSLSSLIRLISVTQLKRRRIIRDNLKLVFGQNFPDWRVKTISNLVYRHFGMNFVEFLRLNKLNTNNIDKKVTFNNIGYLDESLKEGKGALILTAHHGNWDLMATAVGLKGYKVNLITRILKHSNKVNKLWMKLRKHGNVNPIYYKKSIFQIKRALNGNELVGFVIDQYVANANVNVNFLGQPAPTFDALAIMARKFDVPVVPILNHRDPSDKERIIIDILPPLKFIKNENRDEIFHNTQIYSDIISSYIKKYPCQWIWMHQRWKKRD